MLFISLSPSAISNLMKDFRMEWRHWFSKWSGACVCQCQIFELKLSKRELKKHTHTHAQKEREGELGYLLVFASSGAYMSKFQLYICVRHPIGNRTRREVNVCCVHQHKSYHIFMPFQKIGRKGGVIGQAEWKLYDSEGRFTLCGVRLVVKRWHPNASVFHLAWFMQNRKE